MNITATGVLLSLCWSLSVLAKDKVSIQDTAKRYFEVYAKRQDFDQFMAFYAQDAALKDVIYGHEVTGKTQIAAFFPWDRGVFELLNSDNAHILSVEEQLVTGQTVVTRGQFHPFQFNNQKLGPWEFIIWQEYNESGKIIRQHDWINYSPKTIMIGE